MLRWGVLALCWAVAVGACTPSDLSFNTTHEYQCMVVLQRDYKLHWNYLEGEVGSEMAVTTGHDSFVAMAFPDELGRMYPAVAVIGDPSGVRVVRIDSSDFKDSFEFSGGAEAFIGADLNQSSWEQTGGVSTLRLTRNAKRFNKGFINVNIYTEDGRLKFRKHREIPVRFKVDFSTGAFEYGKDIITPKRIHGALLITAFCYVLPFGILVKRYGKPIFGLGNSISSLTGYGMAFNLHVASMTLVLVLVITAFTFIKMEGTGACADTVHSRLGTAVLAIVVALPFLGGVSLANPNPDGLLRKFGQYIHPMIGRALGIICLVQIFDGVEKLSMADPIGADKCRVAAVVGVSVSGGVAVVLEVLKRKFLVKRKARLARKISVSKIPWEEVREHSSEAEPWVVIEGRVFAVKTWLKTHPGGSNVLMEYAGRDATDVFIENAHSRDARSKLEQFYLGELEDDRMVSAITLADDIAMAIVKLNLEHAKLLISDSIDDVPHSLLAAFNSLIGNIGSYLPFLPSPLLEQSQSDDSLKYVELTDFASQAFENDPPTVASIVFTDIQSSTALWETCPTSMRTALQTHNDVIRKAISEHNGYEIKTIGDAFMVAFTHAKDAIGFSFQMQEDLVNTTWPKPLLNHASCKEKRGDNNELIWNGPRVRVGIHVGEVEPQKNPLTGRIDFFGNTVNKAARVEGVAVGGSIAVTEEVLRTVGEDGLKAWGVVDQTALGKVPLKGVGQLSNVTILLPEGLKMRKADVASSVHKTKPRTSVPTPRSPQASSLSTHAPLLRIHKMPLRTTPSTVGTVRVNYRYLKQMNTAPDGIAALLVPAMETVQKTEGIFQCICGSLMLVTWNVSRRCPQHVVQGARFAVMLRGVGWSIISQCEAWGGAVSVGLATGSSLHGKVGTDNLKNMLVIGGVVDLSSMLSHRAATLGTFSLCSSIPGTPGIQDEPSLVDHVRPLQLYSCTPHPPAFSQQLFIHELNCAGLLSCLSSWGFASEGPSDATWEAAFKESVTEALRGSKSAYEEVTKTVTAAKSARVCAECNSDSAVVTCDECSNRRLCSSCVMKTCKNHPVTPLTHGDESTLTFIETAAEAASINSVPPSVYDISLHLSEAQPVGWLGNHRESSLLLSA